MIVQGKFFFFNRCTTFVLLSLTLALVGCGEEPKSGSTSDRISPIYQGPKEMDYCSTQRTFSNPVTITGKATYQARELTVSGLGAAGTARPIRYAEVRITNSSGQEVQCAETDSNGDFSFTLPTGSATYTVAVNSRADNSNLKVSVLNAPEKNQVYSLTTTVKPTTSQSLGTLNAGVTGEVLGGAFNIMDQILNANIYLRSQVGNCSSVVQGCTNFTVAPKVSAYWEKGFNPGSYFDNSPVVSYYLPGYSRLFILGGINGNVDSADTDHFDNSIILHEYGHFLEDIYTTTDSPGGSHSGNRIIDPRLAWGEGWGNFFQAAVRNDPSYIDTYGNSDGSTGYIFDIDLEEPAPGCDDEPGCDIPQDPGEGHFREFSVTRFLWDTIDTANDSEAITGGFPEIWSVLISSDTGFLRSTAAFRDIGLLHFFQKQKTDGISTPITDWDSLRTQHKHRGDRQDYAQYVEEDSTTCNTALNFSITPYDDPEDLGSWDTANLLRNNDFYHIKHSGGPLTLTLNYQTTGGVPEADLDLYLYNESAVYGEEDDIIAYSRKIPSGGVGTAETESITVPSLPAGNYLINVMVFTDPTVGAETDYEIIGTSGGRLCPKDLP